MPTAHELLQGAVRTLREATTFEHPAGKDRADAEELLAAVLGREAGPDEAVTPREARRFARLVARRMAGEPPAYLVGRTTFRGLDLEVGRGCFIPRQSSEFMAEQAIRRLRGRRSPVHVDVATGVGPVALAVAAAVPGARVLGLDLHDRPVLLARRNAARLGLPNVSFLRGDLFAPLPRWALGAVDVVTVHPPYVPRGELRDLPQEIRGFEPRESLTDRSPTGMALLGRVAGEAPRWLRAGGWLLVEVSPDRAREVGKVLRRAGFGDVRSTVGDVKVSRVIVGRRP